MYNFKETEKKWQKIWQQQNLGAASNDAADARPTFYGLIEFPYPSGDGLHIGHVRAFSGLEVVSRFKRLQGYNVLFPIGWDAFGLPTENYAIKTKTHPRIVTDRNIKNFIRQLQSMGFAFDYDRQVDTTSPEFYKHTQWIFIQLFKKGLAVKSRTYINFCPACNVVLANEECQGGVCDRCNSAVEQREKDVWFLKIRNYAERLLQGLETVNYTDRIKQEQINWIGRSEGLKLTFDISGIPVPVFTTRADTIFGVSFMVLAPEHPAVEKLKAKVTNTKEIEKYQAECKLKSEFTRLSGGDKNKSGVILDGVFAVNPINNKKIPVFIADYVLMGYGTGAVMGVPAHDGRDYDFAKKYNLPILPVINGGDIAVAAHEDIASGVLINSDFLNGLNVVAAKNKMASVCAEKGIGEKVVDYKMKDWAFNRQRYWGEPIPIIYCPKCGYLPLPESELPLLLPETNDFTPSADGQSPLAKIESFVNCTCHVCGSKAKRETDTMPQWAGSSWYFLRYLSPHYDKGVVDPQAYKKWGQVDWYNGGMEHVTRHLIYSRFWNMFLYDIGVVTNSEPYAKRTAQGLILGADGEKMSKSLGNVVNPDKVVDMYGADVMRMYILFIGDYEKSAPWNDSGINGCVRFLNRVYALGEKIIANDVCEDINGKDLNEYINKVTADIQDLKFNTAIAQLMTLVNEMYKDGVTKREYADLLRMLNPIAPHITEELWEMCGFSGRLNGWPQADYPVKNKKVEIPVQVNGKLRARVFVAPDSTQDVVKVAALKEPTVQAALEDKQIKKEIFVVNRIYNLIV